MARKSKKEVVSVESTNIPQVQEVEILDTNGDVEKVVNLTAAATITEVEEVEEVEEVVEQPSMLATMLGQEVHPLSDAKPEETTSKPTTIKVEKNQGVGAFVRRLIGEGMSNKDILKLVHEQYGNQNTTYACIAWYRNKMKKAAVEKAVSTAQATVQELLGKGESTDDKTES